MTNIRHNAIAIVAALVISTTCILGAVGPVRAATPNHQIELQNDRNDAQPNAERSQ